jgi:hypothetical protein
MTQQAFPNFQGNDHPQEYNPNPMPPGGMSFNMGAPDPDSTIIANKKLKKIRRRWLWALPAFFAGMAIGATINGGSNEAKAPTSITTLPGSQVSTPGKVTPGAKKVSPPRQFMKQDGVYLVPENIEPGTYRNGGTDTDLCAWVRLKDAGDPDSIITAGFGPNQVVTVKSTDGAIKVTGCGPWVLVTTK